MCKLPVIYRCASTRWAHILKLLLEKEQGTQRMALLTTIYPLETNDNLVFRIIWGWHMIWKAREHKMCMTAQQAQPGRLAIVTVANKILNFDLFRQTKTNGSSGDANATGCFGRITSPKSLINCRR